MRRLLLALIVLASSGELWAQQAGQVGAGLIVGNPFGLTAKYWMNDTQALDAGVGFGSPVLFADFLWHSWAILPQPSQGKIGGYLGVGPEVDTHHWYNRHRDADHRDTNVGIRTLAGVSYWTAGHPIELFLEAGPVFLLDTDSNVDIDAALGIRFYLGPGTTAAK